MTCKQCGAAVTCERHPFGYACVCSDTGCAGHKPERFHLTEEAAQQFFNDRRKAN